jgi:hypothetical protein
MSMSSVAMLLVLLAALAGSTTDTAPTRRSEAEVLKALRDLGTRIEQSTPTWTTTEIENPYTVTRVTAYRAQQVRSTIDPLREEYLQIVRGYPELEAYVEQLFVLPSISGAGPAAAVRKEDGDLTWKKIKNATTRLGRVNELTVRLEIKSVPIAGAHVKLRSVGLTEAMDVATNGTLERVWRGKYKYTVTKAGYKTIEGSLDLVLNSGGEFLCTLQPTNTGESALPCQLQTQ